MARPLPYVISAARDEKAVIKHWEGKQEGAVEVEVDGDAWQTWLEYERSFTVLYYPKAGSDAVRFTVRPEKRGELTYWQAWKTVGGKPSRNMLDGLLK